jgi:hypothetical protein
MTCFLPSTASASNSPILVFPFFLEVSGRYVLRSCRLFAGQRPKNSHAIWIPKGIHDYKLIHHENDTSRCLSDKTTYRPGCPNLLHRYMQSLLCTRRESSVTSRIEGRTRFFSSQSARWLCQTLSKEQYLHW